MIVLAVFGQPVRHSLSPRIHARFAEEAGLDVAYTAIETGPGELSGALEAFRAQGGVGCNVTLPLKHEAMALAATCSERVERAGAANTLILDGDRWAAESTDGTGLVSDLRRLGLNPAGRRVALIGAGGAGASVTAAVLEANPAQLRIYNRSADKAVTLANRHADLGPVEADGFDALGRESFDLVLNATSLGHEGGQPPLSPGLFSDSGVLYDLNYGNAAAPLAAWAAEHNLRFHDGLGMLVGQAAESFRLWTGFEPAAEPVIESLA